MNTIRINLFRIFALGLMLSLALGLNYLNAWTAPTQTAPNGNVAAPLNTGATLQGKSGGLTLGSTLDIGSSLTVGGVPGNGPYLIDMDAAAPGTYAGIRFPDGTVQTTAAAGGGGSLIAIRSYTSNGTWTKPANLSYVVVEVWGGGGAGENYGSANGTNGGSSSFDSVSAAGGTAGNGSSAPGAGGAGSGGDVNLTGGDGQSVQAQDGSIGAAGGAGGSGANGGPGGPGGFSAGAPTGSGKNGKVPGGGGGGAGDYHSSGGPAGGGGGGYAKKRIDASVLSATEAVTVGAGGAGVANGNGNGGNGGAGLVVVYEYQ